MMVPKELALLAHCLRFDTIEAPFSEVKWIDARVATLSLEQRQTIKACLSELLQHNPDDHKLSEAWGAAEFDFLLGGSEQVRTFLNLVQKRL